MTDLPIVTDAAVDAVEKAMSAAFRRYTDTKVGDDMWNLNMERTWGLVARAAVEAAVSHIAVQERERVARYIDRAAVRKRGQAETWFSSEAVVAGAWEEVAAWLREDGIWNNEEETR